LLHEVILQTITNMLVGTRYSHQKYPNRLQTVYPCQFCMNVYVTVWRHTSCPKHVNRCRQCQRPLPRSRRRAWMTQCCSGSMPVCRQLTGRTVSAAYNNYRSLSSANQQLLTHILPRLSCLLRQIMERYITTAKSHSGILCRVQL